MGAGQLRQPVLMAAAAGKPCNRSSPDGNAPFWCLRHHLPPEGGLLVPLCNEQLKLTQGESIEQTFPSGGSTAAGGDRGAFPSGHRPGLPIFPPVRAVVKVLSKLAPQAPTFIYHLQFTIYHFHMGAHHHPLNPVNQPAPGGPNPLNPRGVSRVHHKKYLYPLKDKIE